MTRETWMALFQALLGVAGALLIGHHIFTIPIDQQWITTFGGVVMGVVSIIWGFRDHTETIEKFQAAIRNLMSFLTAILIAGGIKDIVVQQITGAIDAILPVIYGALSRQKTAKIIKASAPDTSNVYLSKLKSAS